MNISIDLTNKVITINEDLTFRELISGLNKLFPNKEWKDFTLKSYMWFPVQSPYYAPPMPYWDLLPHSVSDGAENWINYK